MFLNLYGMEFIKKRLKARKILNILNAHCLDNVNRDLLDTVLVVYHLHGKTSWPTACTNGKRKSPMKIFDQDLRIPIAQPLLNSPPLLNDT